MKVTRNCNVMWMPDQSAIEITILDMKVTVTFNLNVGSEAQK